MQNTILSLKGVTKRYPGVVALDKISVDFKKGEVHALLGENGAGKSTMIKAITGAIDIDEGVIEFEGKEYKGFTTSSSRDLGISAVYQESNLVTQISVANNIFLGDYKTKGAFVDDDAMNKKAEEILHSLGFNVNVRKQALLLSEAQKQLVEIGRALVRNLKVIILDEPTSALMNAEVDMLFDVIQKLKERGITVIYITHIYCHEDFVPLIKSGGVSIIHPDILTSGGLLETKKISDIAGENGVAMAIHMAESPIAAMAAANLAAACDNFLALEFHSHDVEWWDDLVSGPSKPIVNNGFITLDDCAPGLGIAELNDEVIKEHLHPDVPGIWESTEEWNDRYVYDRIWS